MNVGATDSHVFHGVKGVRICLTFNDESTECNDERTMDAKNIGSNFDDFLAEAAILDECNALAMKRVIAWQIEQEMKAQHLTKTTMAKKMRTSRAALNRLLDASDTSLTLTTLSSAAAVLGRKFRIELEVA